jgi:Zn-dependent protease
VLVSLLLVTTNALPFYPFDGGRIVEAMAMRFSWFPVRAFRNGGFVLVLSLVGLALLSDAMRLLGYIFK